MNRTLTFSLPLLCMACALRPDVPAQDNQKLQELVERMRTRLQQVDEQMTRLERTRTSELAAAEGRMRDTVAEMKHALDDASTRAAQAEREHKAAQQETETLRRKLTDLETQTAKLRGQLERLPKLEQQLAKLTHERDAGQAEVEKAAKLIQSLQQDKRKLEQETAKLTQTQRSLEATANERDALRAQLQKLDGQVQSLVSARQIAEQKLTSDQQRLDQAQRALATAAKERDAARAELARAEQAGNDQRTQITALQRELQSAKRTEQERNQQKARIAELERSLASANAQQSSLRDAGARAQQQAATQAQRIATLQRELSAAQQATSPAQSPARATQPASRSNTTRNTTQDDSGALHIHIQNEGGTLILNLGSLEMQESTTAEPHGGNEQPDRMVEAADSVPPAPPARRGSAPARTPVRRISFEP